jgi:hypothetical protein
MNIYHLLDITPVTRKEFNEYYQSMLDSGYCELVARVSYRGKASGNKGRTFSEEHKRKMSETAKNMTEEHRRKLSYAAKNRSEQNRKNISDAAKKRPPRSEESKRKQSLSRTGKTYGSRGPYKPKINIVPA